MLMRSGKSLVFSLCLVGLRGKSFVGIYTANGVFSAAYGELFFAKVVIVARITIANTQL